MYYRVYYGVIMEVVNFRADKIILRILDELAEIWKIKQRKKKYRSETIRLAILYAYMHVKYGITLGKDSKKKVIAKLLKEIKKYSEI